VIGSGEVDGWHNASIAAGPGVVIGRATHLGRPKFVRGPYWPLNTTLYVKDFRSNDERFIYYLFATLDLSGYNSGSVQPMLNRNYISKVSVMLPPVPQQRAIAEVLGALDDGIEARRHTNRRVDELASALFGAMCSDGVRGDTAPLVSRVEILSGGTPKTSLERFWKGSIPWVSVVDLVPGPMVVVTEKTITQEAVESSPAKPLPDRTVVISARGTVGRVALTTGRMAINQSCYGLRDLAGCQHYLFHVVRAAVPELRAKTHGSVFDTITRNSFESLRVPLLPTDDIQVFESRAKPMYDLILSNERVIGSLTRLRDALLPKLLSGELRVQDAARAVGEEA
jgi:type I restriction enzyme S subunit